jgi:hypothetical protein
MNMSIATLIEVLDFNRKRTLAFIDTLAKQPNVQLVLGWRPGPGRSHIAWQLMHIAATDDRHLHVRAQGGQPHNPGYVERFAGGSTPDDDIPALDELRRYLEEQRRQLLAYAGTLDDAALSRKPNDQMPWPHGEWFKVLAWHEAHHQGQAHITFNLYRSAHDPVVGVTGH